MKCFYHSDLDGWCSGAIIKMIHPQCEMIEITYGQSIDGIVFESGETIFVVDFSFPNDIMQMFNEKHDLVWIDHHKTAIEAIENPGEIEGLRTIGLAGCELTWAYLHPAEKYPEIVRLLGRYDVWDKSVPEAWPFQLAAQLNLPDPKEEMFGWENMLTSDNVEAWIKIGEKLKEYQDKQNSHYAKWQSYEVEFEGLRFVVMNRMRGSGLFDSVYDESKHDGMLAYMFTGEVWSYSLYGTKEDVDLSEIAKKYGGGGHKNACGFQSDIKLV
jgi:uncharacterized protein